MFLDFDQITDAQAFPSSARRVLFGVLAILVLPFLPLGLLEGGLRILGYGVGPDFFVPITGQRAFTTNPNFARQFFLLHLTGFRSPSVSRSTNPKMSPALLCLGVRRHGRTRTNVFVQSSSGCDAGPSLSRLKIRSDQYRYGDDKFVRRLHDRG